MNFDVQINDLVSGTGIDLEGMLKGRMKTPKLNKSMEQFESCKLEECCCYNKAGKSCGYETCVKVTDDPLAASMVTKICQFCGNEFSTDLTNMPMQICPACRQAAYTARKHPHQCMFCGSEIDDNPSIFFPVCEKCFTNLRIVATGRENSLVKSANRAHCYDCEV